MDLLLQEIMKNMSPEDRASVGQTYVQPLSGPPSAEDIQKSVLAHNAQENAFVGPPTQLMMTTRELNPTLPNVSSKADQSALQTSPSTTSTKIPVDRLNPLGTVKAGESAPNVQDLLAKIQGQSDPELQAAQASRNNMQLISLLGKAGNQILGGQTHTKPDNAVFDELGKNAGQGISDLETRNTLVNDKMKQQELASKLATELNATNPNSSQAAVYRALLNKLTHGTLPTNLGAAELKDLLNPAEKIAAAEQSSLDRAARAEDTKAYRERTAGNREDTSANTLFDKNESQFKQRVLGADRLNDLTRRIKSGELIGSQNVSRELTNEIDQLVRNNQQGGAYGDREATSIKTLYGLIQNLKQWSLGHPLNTIPDSFIPQLEKEAKILQESYFKAYNDTSKELQEGTNIQGKKDVYAKRTAAFNKQHEYNPDDHPHDDAAIQWAKNPQSPGWSQEKADIILKANGVQ